MPLAYKVLLLCCFISVEHLFVVALSDIMVAHSSPVILLDKMQ